ncbi:MAG: galactose ABC transporter substrate-binding protein [Clostridiales bacterium]|nr:galactose ABC transporter substrate-binding protein [Clostridiales bacterium]
MKKILVVMLALVLALSCCSFAMAEMKDEYDVRVLVWKFDDTYGSSVRQGMDKWAGLVGEELGCKINLQMYDAADDMAKQIEQANILVSEKPDFVIINLAEVASGQTLVDMFKGADIPFLFYNKPPTEETYDSVVKDSGSFFVGTLAREAGDMQGEILYDLWSADAASIDLNGDGKIQFVEFEGEPNNAEAIARSQYSQETAEALGVPMEMVVEDWVVANWDSSQAQEKMLATWAAHPEIELVFANNDDMAIGVIAALNQSGYNTGNEGDSSIAVIGVDATDAAYEAIRAGKMTATVKQDGDAMGEANIRFAMNYLINGTWMDGLESKYTLNEDGVSVYIPYAKITAENVG